MLLPFKQSYLKQVEDDYKEKLEKESSARKQVEKVFFISHMLMFCIYVFAFLQYIKLVVILKQIIISLIGNTLMLANAVALILFVGRCLPKIYYVLQCKNNLALYLFVCF